MSSMFASISRFFLSIIPPGTVFARPESARTRTHKPISKFKFALLPLALLLTLFVAAPAPAHAAPTGPSDGMFDCLGEFDIGCRIIGYLFEGKGLGNLGPGSTSVSSNVDSNSIQEALKVTLGFFSNAMLIIAGLMLLYHLIVMVAETAHTGTIGGKETNQLWAPIRLVVAIGLLVPLSSGLNSGQYIVIEIAKWGAGLGSQTWKVFTTAMFDKQSLVPSVSPEVNGLVRSALKTYICMKGMNYYRGTRTAEYIQPTSLTTTDPDGNKTEVWSFSQKSDIGDSICGTFIFRTPATTTNAGPANMLTVSNTNAFKSFIPQIEKAAEDIVKSRTGQGVFEALPPSAKLDTLASGFQQQVIQQINNASPGLANNMYKEITQKMMDAADMYGSWSAGSWFLALTRAQGSIVYAAQKLPETTGVNMAAMDEDSRKLLQAAEIWIDNGARVYSTGGTGTGLQPMTDTGSVALPFSSYIHSVTKGIKKVLNTVKSPNPAAQELTTSLVDLIRSFITLIEKDPRGVAERVLEMMDAYAAKYGLWSSTGASGASSPNYGNVNNVVVAIDDINPFASLIELGHRKIQLAIDYWGVAMVFAAVSTTADSALSLFNLRNVSAWLPDTRPIGNIIGSLGLGIAAFFIIIAAFAMIAGIFLAFLIPLMPFVRFFYALVTWVGSILEAMICMPFLALAFLTPKGEGFSGQKTRFGMMMIFQIFLRPALVIFGMICALLIFYVSVRFLNAMYGEATAGIALFPPRSGVSFVARMVFGIFHVALVYVCANMCFKMIDHIPRRALQWMGDQVSEERYEDEQNVLQNVASGASGQITGEVIQKPVSLLQTHARLGR